MEFGFDLLWDLCTVYLSCDCSPAFRICCFSGRRFVSCATIDFDMEMFTGNEGTKVWHGSDITSISLLLACHVSSASMSGV